MAKQPKSSTPRARTTTRSKATPAAATMTNDTGIATVTAKTPPRPRTRKKPAAAPTHDQIAERAYLMWESAGRPQGQDAAFWHAAERELTAAK